ncbi:MAG: phosphotransferase [Acidimicrobiia bacterium]
MSFNHPRTAVLEDLALPEVSTLLSSPTPGPIDAAVSGTGGRVEGGELLQVTWWPGISITARYRASIKGGELEGTSTFVCVAGRIPHGALVVENENGRVGVWRLPHDPALPGLEAALDSERTAQLLEDLGGAPGPVDTRLVAYRPGRRAVVSVSGRQEGLYLKLVRPSHIEDLHRSHQALAESLPVPASLGFSRDLGLIALQAVPGSTLRSVLEHPDQRIPSPADIVELPRRIPPPGDSRESPSPIGRLADIRPLLSMVSPELSDQLDDVVEQIGPETSPADTPCHGDYYESQLLVEGGAVIGMLDVDTYGRGRAADDAATMLGHLAIWAGMSRQPARVRDLGDRLIRVWDELLDPVDLRLRTAAVVLSLATGPFRVQSAAWPEETADRVDIASKWLQNALEIR